MGTKNIHGQHIRPARARGVYRFGLLASACLGVVGLAAGAAQAVAGTADANNSVHALANPGHPNVFQDSFEVYQFGSVVAAGAHNQAEAESVSCSAKNPCRSISLAFQIVTMAGAHIHLDAVNLSNSQNVHCAGCQSLAGAYQFVVSTPRAFTLSTAAQQELGQIHDKLNALGSSHASIAQLKADADALAAQVTAILNAAPKGIQPLSNATAPPVTVHRMFNQS